MHVGLHVASFTWAGDAPAIGDTLADVAQAAEEAGCQHVWFGRLASTPI